MKAILKYPGSKWRIADWIISFFPEHHSYVEPFFGSGAVFFNKPASNIETLNDLDGDVVNFFEWLRKDPERLSRELFLTPFSRQEYNNALSPSSDSFEQAVKFCIRLNMGYGYRTNERNSGWKCDVNGREKSYALKDWNNMPNLIIQAAERLKEAQIECRPALDVIKRFNSKGVLLYCDPPYMLDTRHGEQYKEEMTAKDHEDLLNALLISKADIILSGYNNALYNDVLKDWHRERIQSLTQNAQKSGQEILWMNFEPMQQLKL